MINGKDQPDLGPEPLHLRDEVKNQPFSESRPTLGSPDKILRNGLLNLFGQGSLAVFHLVVVFVLARTLGKEGLGEFYTIFALIQVIQLVMEGSISTVLTCRLTQDLSNWKKIVAEGAGLFTLVVILSVGVMLGLGVLWSWWIDNPARLTVFAIGAVACGAIQVNRFCTGVFRAFENVTIENYARIVHGAAFAAFVCLFALQGFRATRMFLAAFALSHVLGSSYLLWALFRRLGWFGWRLNGAVLKDWLAVTIPLGLGDIVRKWTWQLDTILLSLLQPAAVVGIYSIAYRPLGPLNWLPSAILAAVFPSLARMATVANSSSLERAF